MTIFVVDSTRTIGAGHFNTEIYLSSLYLATGREYQQHGTIINFSELLNEIIKTYKQSSRRQYREEQVWDHTLISNFTFGLSVCVLSIVLENSLNLILCNDHKWMVSWNHQKEPIEKSSIWGV